MNAKRPPGRPSHGDQITRDLGRTIKGVWDAFTSPETFFDVEDSARADEPILSGAECSMCGNAPLTRADGLQIRCPECGEMHPPKAAKEIR